MTLHCITSHYIILNYITSHYMTLHYITSHYTILNYITSHYITLYTLHYYIHTYILSYCTYIHTYCKDPKWHPKDPKKNHLNVWTTVPTCSTYQKWEVEVPKIQQRPCKMESEAKMSQMPCIMTGSNYKLLQIQGKWHQERNPTPKKNIVKKEFLKLIFTPIKMAIWSVYPNFRHTVFQRNQWHQELRKNPIVSPIAMKKKCNL